MVSVASSASEMDQYLAHPSSMSREALYDAVWSVPMTQLSRQYGITGHALRKICIQQQIPSPNAGYWTKVAVGKTVDRPPLNPFAEATKKRPVVAARQEKSPANVAQVTVGWPLQIHAESEARIKWHPVLASLRSEIAEAAINAKRLKRICEWEERNPRLEHPDRKRLSLYGLWSQFCAEGQILLNSHRKSVFRVSFGHYERGLRILNSVTASAVARGYQVSIQNDFERLVLTQGESSVTLRMTEKLEIMEQKVFRSYNKSWESVRTYAPTGRLTVFMKASDGREKAVGDQPDRGLEQSIENILKVLDARHVASIKRDEENRLWKVRLEEGRRQRAEQHRREEEARKLAAEEKARRDALIAEVSSWREAEAIRDYLAELDRRFDARGLPMVGYDEWRAWAAAAARALDQSDARVKRARE